MKQIFSLLGLLLLAISISGNSKAFDNSGQEAEIGIPHEFELNSGDPQEIV